MKRLIAALLAAVLLLLTTACGGGIAAGTVTSKGLIHNSKSKSNCWWIKVRHDDGSTSKGCIAAGKWKHVRKGDHWSGS